MKKSLVQFFVLFLISWTLGACTSMESGKVHKFTATPANIHNGMFESTVPPVLKIDPGDTVVFNSLMLFEGKLKAGMFVQGELLTGVNGRALVIPGSAVYRNDRSAKSSYVFVIQDGKAVRRDVQIGRERDSVLEITGGLKPGDRVIVEQNIEIPEGVRIEARR